MESKTKVRGPGRTTKADWIRVALDTLIDQGVEQVKVLTLASKLNCARSSFYWYFKDRSELLGTLLKHWVATNTQTIVDSANQPADTITQALAHLYVVWNNADNFDTDLDFAIRDWARRDDKVKRAVDINDVELITSITEMFIRHNYPIDEADARARIVYFTQIGYNALDQREAWDTRMSRCRLCLFCMTGVKPSEQDVNYLVMAGQPRKRSTQSMELDMA